MSRITCLFILLLASGVGTAQTVSLDDVTERGPKKEPRYLAQPLYAEFVMAPEASGKGRMWAVLDKSKAELDHYDVLYIDRDCDGDLTDENEKVTANYNEAGARAGVAIKLKTGPLVIPGTKLVHQGFFVSTVRKPGRKGIWFQMKWDGKHEISGGYGDFGMDVTIWKKSAAEAPLIRPDPMGRLSFATWGSKAISIKAGMTAKVNVIIGNPGSGPDTMAVVDENFIDLEKEQLIVTVIAKDAYGKKVEASSRITEHC